MYEVISTGTEVADESGTAGAQVGEQNLEDLVFAESSVVVDGGRSQDEAAAAPRCEQSLEELVFAKSSHVVDGGRSQDEAAAAPRCEQNLKDLVGAESSHVVDWGRSQDEAAAAPRCEQNLEELGESSETLGAIDSLEKQAVEYEPCVLKEQGELHLPLGAESVTASAQYCQLPSDATLANTGSRMRASRPWSGVSFCQTAP